MEADKAIAELGARLDEWFDGSAETFASQDRTAQGKAILRGVEIIRQFDRLKADGKAAFTAWLIAAIRRQTRKVGRRLSEHSNLAPDLAMLFTTNFWTPKARVRFGTY